MKKFLTVLFTALSVFSLGVYSFAASGTFVSSPSANRAPTLIEASNASEDCEAEIQVMSYADRNKLGEEKKAKIEAAYNSIATTEDLATLDSAIGTLADKLGISSKKLLVSDLFDVSYSNCETHEDHEEFTITVKPESVKNYAGLIHYTNDGWELVESSASSDGTITFTADDLSPFAIIVHDGSVNSGFQITDYIPLTQKQLKLIAAGIIAIAVVGLTIIIIRKLASY